MGLFKHDDREEEDLRRSENEGFGPEDGTDKPVAGGVEEPADAHTTAESTSSTEEGTHLDSSADTTADPALANDDKADVAYDDDDTDTRNAGTHGTDTYVGSHEASSHDTEVHDNDVHDNDVHHDGFHDSAAPADTSHDTSHDRVDEPVLVGAPADAVHDDTSLEDASRNDSVRDDREVTDVLPGASDSADLSDPDVAAVPVAGVPATAGAATSTVADAEKPRPSQGDEPLFESGFGDDLRKRWHDVQAGFVDDPYETVEQAEQLAREVLDKLTSALNDRKQGLDGRWHAEKDNTEELRQSLRGYKQLVEKLLSI